MLSVKDSDYLKACNNGNTFDNQLENSYYTIFDVSIEGIHIFIDAIDGVVLGQDYELSKDSNIQNAYYLNEGNKKERAQYLNRIMSKLGYSSQTVGYGIENSAARKSIINYLNNNNKYAFTFSGHGSPSAIGTSDDTLTITTSDIKSASNKRTNPWRFVFLDACSTAVNTDWMRSFNIYPKSTKKLYMGWSANVYANETLDFMKKFCNKVENSSSTKPIGRIALEIVFQGTGKIRVGVGGDLTWNGRR